MSIAAYRKRQEAAESPRELESRAFRTVIGKLTEAKEKGGRTLIDACFLNNQLWSALAIDLALPTNGLAVEVKAQLISIALWVQRYTPQAMNGGAPVDPLIAVNRNILDGLSIAQPANPNHASMPQVGAA